MCRNVDLHQGMLVRAIALLFVSLLLLPIHANAADASLRGVWEGTIGKQTVTVCFERGSYSSYFYESHKSEIPLSRQDIPLSEKVGEWTENVNSEMTGIWTMSDVQDDKLEGSWKNSKSQRTLPIRLKRVTAGDDRFKCFSSVYVDRLTEAPSTAQSNAGIPGLENVRDIAAGNNKSCALLGDGNVKCWWMDQSKNELVFEDKHRTDIEAIAFQSAYDTEALCMVSRDKTVSCSGTPLGNVTFDHADHFAPVSAVVSPSAEFVCVLAGDGRVQCAGNNQYGQLGDGSTTSSQTPVFVTELNDAKSLSLSDSAACAILNNGHVKCWGGDFIKLHNVMQPHEIRGVRDATSMSISLQYVCVLLQDRTVNCWGRNNSGQLGDGKAEDSELPVTVRSLNDAVSIIANGANSTCVLLKNGGIKCWGLVSQDPETRGSDAEELFYGYKKAMALTSERYLMSSVLYVLEKDKTVRCGPLNANERKIYKIAGLVNVVKLAGGNGHMCALLGNGHVRCWSSDHITQTQNLMTITFDSEQRPEYAYVANIGDGTISAYSINSATGAFTQVAGSQLVAGASSITINPAGTFAYVTTTKGAISIYRINPNTGALTQIEGSSVAAGKYPITVTVNPAGNIAYVTNNDSQTISQTILTYSINAKTGALTLIPGSPLMVREGISSFTINPAGTFAYVATGNTISVYRINVMTGALTPVADSPFMGDAVPGSLAINPAGTFVYVVNINEDSVSTYRINANTGALTLVKGSPFTAGKSPITVTVNPAGTFAYVANMGDNTISAYRITTTGALTPIAGSPFYVSRQPHSVTINPAGTFLYISNTNNDSVSAYRINVVTGALTEVESSPFTAGSGPQSVTVVQP